MFLVVKYSNDSYDIIDINDRKISGLLKAEKNKVIKVAGRDAIIVEMGPKKKMEIVLAQYQTLSTAPKFDHDLWATSSFNPNFSRSKSKFQSSFNRSRSDFKSSKPYADAKATFEEQANKLFMKALAEKQGPLFDMMKAKYEELNGDQKNDSD
uniref:Uncharacterized protein n=1 Tax=Panagrolaimus sp. JU765 TaxID=591449 RepID=A0AC34QTC4_9BILA